MAGIGKKFFVVTVRTTAQTFSRYMGKHNAKVKENVTDEQWLCIKKFWDAAVDTVQCLRTWTEPT